MITVGPTALQAPRSQSSRRPAGLAPGVARCRARPARTAGMLGLESLAGRSVQPSASSRCGCRAASSPACAMAMPTTRCCVRCCRWTMKIASCPDSGCDAVGDGEARRGGGLIHKYQGRALLIATGSCAVHCRYCFRRHYPYARGHRRRSWLARGGRDHRRRPLAARGHPVRRRSAVAGRPQAGRTDRCPERHPAHPSPAHPHPAAGGAARTCRCRPAGLAARLAVAGHGGAPRQPCQRIRCLGRCRPGRIARRPVPPCSTRQSCCAGSTIPWMPWPSCANAASRPACCPTTCTSWTGSPALRTSRSMTLAQWALHAALAARLPGYLLPRLVREVAGAPGKTPLVAHKGHATAAR